MRTTIVKFKNRPNEDGTITPLIIVRGCLVANNGSPTADRPMILIHLPRTFTEDVVGAWVDYDGHSFHVIGVSNRQMDTNTPTDWDRYAIAERPTKRL